MNSPFTTLFLAVADRIQTMVPAIRCTDQDMGQIDYYQTQPAIQLPCALIDLNHFTASDYSENAQTLTGQVAIRLAFAPASSAAPGTPRLYQQKALQYYDIEYALHQSLQGWVPADGIGTLSRQSIITENREDALRVRQLIYTVSLEDYSTRADVSTAVANVVIGQ